jgi:hypothetical protein
MSKDAIARSWMGSRERKLPNAKCGCLLSVIKKGGSNGAKHHRSGSNGSCRRVIQNNDGRQRKVRLPRNPQSLRGLSQLQSKADNFSQSSFHWLLSETRLTRTGSRVSR